MPGTSAHHQHNGGRGKPLPQEEFNMAIMGLVVLIMMVFLFPMLVYAIISTSMDRITPISNYNSRVDTWNNEQKEVYNVASFQVNDMDAEKVSLDLTGYNPVADGCNELGEPIGGCKKAQTVYFKKNIPPSTSSTSSGVIKNQQGMVIFEWDKDIASTITFTDKELGCEGDADKCQKLCRKLNGSYIYQCTVPAMLTKLCIRVRKNEGVFVLDNAKSSLFKISGVGCMYSNNYSPFHYEAGTVAPTTISIEIRNNMDPIISASEFTRGCSDPYCTSNVDKKCFGVGKSYMMVVGIAVGVVAFLIIILVIVCICKCNKKHKETQAKNKKKKEKELKRLEEMIRTGATVTPAASQLIGNNAQMPGNPNTYLGPLPAYSNLAVNGAAAGYNPNPVVNMNPTPISVTPVAGGSRVAPVGARMGNDPNYTGVDRFNNAIGSFIDAVQKPSAYRYN